MLPETGCPLNKPLNDYFRHGELFECYKLDNVQKRILWLLGSAGFTRLHVSQPSYEVRVPLVWYHYNNHHAAGSKAIDLIAVERNALPDLLRAFFALSEIWPGGVGIGIRGADLHLHVDGWYTNNRRWIEIAKGKGTEVTNQDPRFTALLAEAREVYGYKETEDWRTYWQQFFGQHNLTPSEALDYMKQGFGFLESVLKWSVVGLVAYFGLRAVGLIESFRGK